MPLNLQVHSFSRKNGREILGRVTPYARLVRKDEPVFVVQDGCVYGQGGVLVEPADVPEWVWEAIDSMDPTVRGELKAKRPPHSSTKKAS